MKENKLAETELEKKEFEKEVVADIKSAIDAPKWINWVFPSVISMATLLFLGFISYVMANISTVQKDLLNLNGDVVKKSDLTNLTVDVRKIDPLKVQVDNLQKDLDDKKNEYKVIEKDIQDLKDKLLISEKKTTP